MRKPYFADANRPQVLLNQLHEWAATRWQHAGTEPNAMRCGIHADCLFWVKVFKVIGALPSHLEIPDYRMQEARGDEMVLLTAKIVATQRADLVWKMTPNETKPRKQMAGQDVLEVLRLPWLMIGDVLIFTNGTSGAHCGLVVKPMPIHFLHLSINGMLEEPLAQAHYAGDLRFVYRLLEEVA